MLLRTLIGFAVFGTLSHVTSSVTWAQSQVNVVMILADDQSYRDFGFMGNADVHTPNLDSLASQAARFRHGYVPMSVCRPSLATLLTGLYPHQHGIHFNHPPPGLSVMRSTMTGREYQASRATTDHLITRVPTLPRILASHGYACLQTGKHWEADYATAGFTHGMTRNRPAGEPSPINGTREQSNGDLVAHGNGDAGLLIGRETMKPIDDFIDQHAGKRPFLVWYAPFLPHTPFDADERFHQVYAGKNIPAHLRPYYAEIARFDATVGHLLSRLRQAGVSDSTLVILASDNGFRPDVAKPNKQNRRSKLSEFEDGLRTPILIRMPGKTVPADHDQLVSTVDLVPTVLSAVGLAGEITSQMSGIDLMPSVYGDASLPNRPICGAIYPNDAVTLGEPAKHVRARWIRSGVHKLIVPGPASPKVTRALFNLKDDPREMRNLYGDASQLERIAEMKAMLDRWWNGRDAPQFEPSPVVE